MSNWALLRSVAVEGQQRADVHLHGRLRFVGALAPRATPLRSLPRSLRSPPVVESQARRRLSCAPPATAAADDVRCVRCVAADDAKTRPNEEACDASSYTDTAGCAYSEVVSGGGGLSQAVLPLHPLLPFNFNGGLLE